MHTFPIGLMLAGSKSCCQRVVPVLHVDIRRRGFHWIAQAIMQKIEAQRNKQRVAKTCVIVV